LLVACNDHSAIRVEIVKEDCMSCHTASKQQLAHPEETFPIATGPHSQDNQEQPMQCSECHDFVNDPVNAGMAGVNANCIGACHLRADTEPLHAGVANFTWDATTKDSCLGCHPNGLVR
jgi:hypothetical protein